MIIKSWFHYFCRHCTYSAFRAAFCKIYFRVFKKIIYRDILLNGTIPFQEIRCNTHRCFCFQRTFVITIPLSWYVLWASLLSGVHWVMLMVFSIGILLMFRSARLEPCLIDLMLLQLGCFVDSNGVAILLVICKLLASELELTVKQHLH